MVSCFPLSLVEIEVRIRAAPDQGLPGLTAQLRMAPRPRPGWRRRERPPGARRAAALLLLMPGEAGPSLVLTVRSRTLPQHAGQVSLPGGAVEPGEALETAAIREAHEEIALDPALVRVAGPLSPLHIPVSGFALHPIVGVAPVAPVLRPAEREVGRILVVPLAVLADPAHVRRATMVRDGREYDVPSFDVAGERVWGATAMVLAEFLWVLGCPPDPWRET
jgi:8-oxo-dGTP pyrophosphatase MutT (NUDIX family)